MGQYSDGLRGQIHEILRRKGLNTASLAKAMGEDRRRVRAILGGAEPLTVDDFARMVEALELSPQDLGMMAAHVQDSETEQGDEAEPLPSQGPRVVESPEDQDDRWILDPDGIPAEQLFRIGFAMGIDFFFVSECRKLADSGVPTKILEKFGELLPIKLDAAYHRYNQARYSPEGVELRVSFDGVYTCLFPWSAIREVRFFPEAPLVQAHPTEPEPPSPGRPFLKLVKS